VNQAPHTAHFALLANGPHEGEKHDIEPGQLALWVGEDGYRYEHMSGNDPDTAVFTYRESGAVD
jgi:hypothetical protein